MEELQSTSIWFKNNVNSTAGIQRRCGMTICTQAHELGIKASFGGTCIMPMRDQAPVSTPLCCVTTHCAA